MGRRPFIKSRAHVRDRKGYSINLRVQAYSCHPVRSGRGEGGWDTDLKAFRLNNGCPVFWKRARSSQFNPSHPFLSFGSHCSNLFSPSVHFWLFNLSPIFLTFTSCLAYSSAGWVSVSSVFSVREKSLIKTVRQKVLSHVQPFLGL